MAHYAKAISLLFLIGLFLSISLEVEARESKHFSKVTHSHHRQPQYAPELAPSPSPAPAPEETIIQPPMTSNGYGLFGHHESTQFPPSTATTTTTATTATISGNDENEFRGEELSQNYKEETSNPYYNNNNNNYNTNGYYTTKYNYNGNYRAGEKQGMSDTRYLENRKYYYNARNDNSKNNNNYYSNSNGYQQPAVVRGSRSSNNGGYFGKTQYEFDSMEEYERQQGYYPETQGEFVP